MKRYQARRVNLPFARNTLENTCGLHGNWCHACGGFSPSKVGEPRPTHCQHCGSALRLDDQPTVTEDEVPSGDLPQGAA